MRKKSTSPELGFIEMLRWSWTQLTSMRTALFLLLLLAIAAVPGSLLPQRVQNPGAVSKYIDENPQIGPILDSLQGFDVYSSFWFSAIYLLLFISLVGCVIPRAKQHYKQWRAKPPKTPRNLSRLPEHGVVELDSQASITEARDILKAWGYRLNEDDLQGQQPAIAAERGFTKELGNLIFHVALIGVMISVAISGLMGYRGQKIIVEGDTFVNNLVSYDNFRKGAYYNQDNLEPFSVRLDTFTPTFNRDVEAGTKNYGQPLDFQAKTTIRDGAGAQERQQTLQLNEPLGINGTDVYLVGNGFAPVVTVRDEQGNIASQGPVVTVPNDTSYTSTFVLKVPDAREDQLGFVGLFLPTAVENEDGVAFSVDPDPFNPTLNLNSYYGDLGLDSGEPENVYVLNTSKLTELNSRNLDAGGIVLEIGQSYQLPEGKGSISFEGLKRYIGVDITYDPGKVPALIFALLALAGLMASLFIGRRRVWVRVKEQRDDGLVLEFGLLARGQDQGLAAEASKLQAELSKIGTIKEKR